MDVLGLILFAFVGLVAVAFSAVWFFQDLFRFLAPDNADEAAIKRQFGENTPDARRAMARRFGGPRSHLKDAVSGVGGLLGLAMLYWMWFG